MFHSLFISVLIKAVSVSIPFEHTSHFKEDVSFIVSFHLDKYSFSLNTFSTRHVFLTTEFMSGCLKCATSTM